MKQSYFYITGLALVAVSLAVGHCSPNKGVHAVHPAGPKPKAAARAKPVSERDRLWLNYQKTIAAKDASHEAVLVDFYKKLLKEYRQRDREIPAKRQGFIEQMLATKNRRKYGKPADFNGQGPEWDMLSPTSPDSAQVFSELLDQDLVDREELCSALYRTAHLACSQWIGVLRRIADTEKQDSITYRWAILCLYRANVSRSSYRPLLERMARDKNDVNALETLLFSTDKLTGSDCAMDSNVNRDLVHSLIRKGNDPEIRAKCAEFAIAVGERAIANATCIDIVRQEYEGRSAPEESPERERDSGLGRAKTFAMYTLFYKIRSVDGFQAIYDLSTLPNKEDSIDPHPEAGPSLSAYPPMSLTIDVAQGLIGNCERDDAR